LFSANPTQDLYLGLLFSQWLHHLTTLRCDSACPLLGHGLPREVVDAPSLETPTVRLEGALRNLIYLLVTLFTAGEFEQMTLKGPF